MANTIGANSLLQVIKALQRAERNARTILPALHAVGITAVPGEIPSMLGKVLGDVSASAEILLQYAVADVEVVPAVWPELAANAEPVPQEASDAT